MSEGQYERQAEDATRGFNEGRFATSAIAFAIFFGIKMIAAAMVRCATIKKS